MPESFSEKQWQVLLRAIASKNVIPIIGPAAVTVRADGGDQPLQALAAPRLAQELGLLMPEQYRTFNDVARAHLGRGGSRSGLYDELRLILDSYREPGAALLALAGIEGFDLFVSSTPDSLLANALKQRRQSFTAQTDSFWFHPNLRSQQHTHEHADQNNPCDLPSQFSRPLVYQILGSTESQDFAVWEEDYMEFVCGLIEKRENLKRLMHKLSTANLLLIGAPSEDWIVRFLLRLARGKRLSDSADIPCYLAEDENAMSEAMTFFFDHGSKHTRIIRADPVQFALELAQRWQQHRKIAQPATTVEFFARLPDQCPRDAVFISYAKEDKAAVAQLGSALEHAGVPFWVDKRNLEIGESYERALRTAVMDCSYFVALISPNSESDHARYVHKERTWAAERYTEGSVFYVPVLLDFAANAGPQLEPPVFHKIERERLTPERLPALVQRLAELVQVLRSTGKRPRG